ncbi:iron transporter [Halobaculum sp. MBLA0147]|uniref:iron transporter n=1 Tax=Halobaculum sp. MBLA0147 TaxID=3079934 RepID=UPI003524569C
MDRRRFLATAGAAGSAALAGCGGLIQTRPARTTPPVVENRPDGVYVPSHVEGMEIAGVTRAGGLGFGLMYSYPHRFWNVNGSDVSKTEIDDGDEVHLMASVWDRETGTVLPETGLTVEITRDDALVSQETIYPMLSQPMGFHYGANFGLEGDGTYQVRLNVGGVRTRKTGGFVGRFESATTATIDFDYERAVRDEISFERLGDRAGARGAVDPMQMEMLPSSTAPTESALPGRVVGRASSDDVVFLVTVLDSPPAGIDADGQYLAVSARTPYNRMVIPAMALRGTLTRDGESVFDGELVRTIDPDLNYHYGAVVDEVTAGDELTVQPRVQPQTARHEGFETAFGGVTGPMSDVSLTVE